jgi:hypothetical protein
MPKKLETRFDPASQGGRPRKSESAGAAQKEEAIARLLKYRGRMPRDFVFDREDANKRGSA